MSALDDLKAWADRLGRFLPGMGGPSTDEITRMSPDEYQEYKDDLARARVRAQPKVRRIVGNAAKSLYSVNPDTGEVEFFAKNPMHMERPEIADELLALPDWFQPIAEMAGAPYVPPDWAKEASAHTQQVQEHMQDQLDYPPASTKEEYALETLGSMLGQLPVPEGSFTKLKAPFKLAGEKAREVLGPVAGRAAQAATLVPRAGIEFFSPIVEPSLKNYAMGTGFGAGLQSLLRNPTQDEFEALKWKTQRGEMDPDEAIKRLSDLISRTKPGELNLGDDEPVGIGHAKGGPVSKAQILKLFRGIMGSATKGIPDDALAGKPRPEYGAAFFSSDPHVAASYGTPMGMFKDEAGVVSPVDVEAHEVIDFPVKEDGTFDKFAFDRAAKMLEPGQVLRAKQVYDYGPRASAEFDPEKKYSYRSDIYAVGPGTNVKSSITKKAKGGPIKPPNLMSLRKSIEGMLREAEELKGSGKEMVPVEPPAEPQLPAQPDITPTLEDLKQMAGESAPTPEPTQITDMPISRRTFLRSAMRGAGALMSPVKLDLGSLLTPSSGSLELSNLGAKAMTEPKDLMGVIARLNDGEGYERSAWGLTIPSSRRALVDKLAEGMQEGQGEFENLDQIRGTLNEFGTSHYHGLESGVKDPLQDRFEALMSMVRSQGFTGDEDMPHALEDALKNPDSIEGRTYHDVGWVKNEIAKYAEAEGIPFEQARDKVLDQTKQDAKNNLWAWTGQHNRENLDWIKGTVTEGSEDSVEDLERAVQKAANIPGGEKLTDLLKDAHELEKKYAEDGFSYDDPYIERWKALRPQILKEANDLDIELSHQEATPATRDALKAIQDNGHQNVARFMDADELWAEHPHLSPGEVLDLHDMVKNAPNPNDMVIPRDELESFLSSSAADISETRGDSWASEIADAAQESDPYFQWPHERGFSELKPKFENFMKENGVWQDTDTGDLHYNEEGAKRIGAETSRVGQWLDMSDLEKKYRLRHGEEDPWKKYGLGGDDDVDYHGGYVDDMLDALDAFKQYKDTGTWPKPDPAVVDWKKKEVKLSDRWHDMWEDYGTAERNRRNERQMMNLVKEHLGNEKSQELQGLLDERADSSSYEEPDDGGDMPIVNTTDGLSKIYGELRDKLLGPDPRGPREKYVPPEPEFADMVGEVDRWAHVEPQYNDVNKADIEKHFGPIPDEVVRARDAAQQAYNLATQIRKKGQSEKSINRKALWNKYNKVAAKFHDAALDWLDSLNGQLRPLEKDDAE